MKFELADKNCIVAVLSCYDLYEMGLSYDEIDYCDEKTRLALGEILSKGKVYADNIDGFLNKMRIDVLPSEDDGCVIFFTDLEMQKENDEKCKTVFFFSESFDNLLDLSRAAQKNGCKYIQSSLYKSSSGFYLCAKNPPDSFNLLCREFMSLCGNENFLYERIKECCVCLIESDALGVISGKQS